MQGDAKGALVREVNGDNRTAEESAVERYFDSVDEALNECASNPEYLCVLEKLTGRWHVIGRPECIGPVQPDSGPFLHFEHFDRDGLPCGQYGGIRIEALRRIGLLELRMRKAIDPNRLQQMVSGRNYLFQSDWRRCFVGNHPPIQRGLYVGPNGLDYLTIASLDGPAEVERTCLARIFPLDSDGLEGTQTSQALEPHLDTTVAPITAPSKTVALIGFSCSGKSTLGKRVVNALKVSKSGPLIHRDSDEEIGQPFGGIAELYMRLGYDAAIDYITEQERVFLRSLQYSSVPQLVVFGPNVVLRDPEWKEFLDRVKPTIVYLTVSLPVCYNRLRKRDDSAMIKYAGQPNAGCWNRGVFREPGREFPEVEAKEHLKANMRTQIERYEAVSEPARTFDAIELQKGARLAAAIQQIRDALK